MQPDYVRVFIEYGTLSKRRELLVSRTAPVTELTTELIAQLGLPRTSGADHSLTYALRWGDRRLLPGDTLAGIDLADGETLTLTAQAVPLSEYVSALLNKAQGFEAFRLVIQHVRTVLSVDSQDESRLRAELATIEEEIPARERECVPAVFQALDLSNIPAVQNSLGLPEYYLGALTKIEIDNHPVQRSLVAQIVAVLVHEWRERQALEQQLANLRREVEGLRNTYNASAVDLPLPGRAVFTISLDREFEEFGAAQQHEWLSQIATVSGTRVEEIRLLAVRRGSVLVTLEVPAECLERVLSACKGAGFAKPTQLDSQHPAPLVLASPDLIEFVDRAAASICIGVDANLSVSFHVQGSVPNYVSGPDSHRSMKWNLKDTNTELRAIGSIIALYRQQHDREGSRDALKAARRIGDNLRDELFHQHPQLLAHLGSLNNIPVEKVTYGFGGTHTYLCMPYEMLPDPEGTHPLVVQHPVVREVWGVTVPSRPTLGSIARARVRGSSQQPAKEDELRILIIAAGERDDECAALDQEVDELESVFKKSESQGQIAEIRCCRTAETNSQQIQQLLERCKYHIVHYAGGCVFDARTGDSGLPLREAPGKITQTRVSPNQLQMRLQQSKTILFFVNAGLSAAVLDNEDPNGHLGVIDAIIKAGVPNVIGHHWPIDREKAMLFAKDFYENLLEHWSPARAAHYARNETYLRDPADETWLSPIVVSHQWRA